MAAGGANVPIVWSIVVIFIHGYLLNIMCESSHITMIIEGPDTDTSIYIKERRGWLVRFCGWVEMALARPSGCRCCQPCSRCINVLPYVPVKERVVDTRSNEKRKRGGSQRHRRQSKLAVGEDRLVFRFWYRHNIHNTERRRRVASDTCPSQIVYLSDMLLLLFVSLSLPSSPKAHSIYL